MSGLVNQVRFPGLMSRGDQDLAIHFVWSDSYRIGVYEADRQHQQLFDLANALPEDPSEAELKRAIMALYVHTREHFAFEEALMQRMGYPKCGEHTRQHEDLIERLNRSAQDLSGSPESILAVKQLLHEWVIDHIATFDREYARFAQSLQLIGV